MASCCATRNRSSASVVIFIIWSTMRCYLICRCQLLSAHPGVCAAINRRWCGLASCIFNGQSLPRIRRMTDSFIMALVVGLIDICEPRIAATVPHIHSLLLS
ncbi:hypothetical protein DE146DRAFT_255668 [Phaeosphaeria sp. MPI-PUGE-AT-0046c]|nr:hypothetical protein DE146DRAFT_255668 [Phaeosphaeria sp. MPI-PUGE-AT-0046c]